MALAVADLERSIAFYRVLGFKIAARWKAKDGSKEIAFLEQNGTRLELLAPDRSNGRCMEGDVGLAHLCLATDDLEAEVARLREKGIAVTEAPHTIGGGAFHILASDPRYPLEKGLHRATFRDPDGVVVELLEVKK